MWNEGLKVQRHPEDCYCEHFVRGDVFGVVKSADRLCAWGHIDIARRLLQYECIHRRDAVQVNVDEWLVERIDKWGIWYEMEWHLDSENRRLVER